MRLIWLALLLPYFCFADEVQYTCEFLDNNDIPLTKKEMYKAIEEKLNENLKTDSLSASISLLYTFCPDEKRRNAAIEIIGKYVQNIIAHPTDPKFLQIRMRNKVFSEKVVPVKGAIEFLNAIGFREEFRALMGGSSDQRQAVIPSFSASSSSVTTVADQQQREAFLVMPQPKNDADANALRDSLNKALEELQRGIPIEIQLFRDPQVLHKTEQRHQKFTNGYCVIGVRFPSDYMLQGIFHENEKLSDVRRFVAQHLSFQYGPFSLTPSVATSFVSRHQRRKMNEENTLKEYGLDQMGIVHFQWDAETLALIDQLPDDQQPHIVL